MELVQVYGDPGVPLVIQGADDDVALPFDRHRIRMQELIGGLDPEAWTRPTRCDKWRVVDLVNHLSTGGRFWDLTLSEAQKGVATRVLEGFDPRTTPLEMTDGMASLTPEQSFAAPVESDTALLGTVARFDSVTWSAMAEGPGGHVPARMALNHAMFDSWVHERDLLHPLGIETAVEADEVLLTLRYLIGLAALVSGQWANGGEISFGIDNPCEATVHVALNLPVEISVVGGLPASGPVADGPALIDAISGRDQISAVVSNASQTELSVLGALSEFLS